MNAPGLIRVMPISRLLSNFNVFQVQSIPLFLNNLHLSRTSAGHLSHAPIWEVHVFVGFGLLLLIGLMVPRDVVLDGVVALWRLPILVGEALFEDASGRMMKDSFQQLAIWVRCTDRIERLIEAWSLIFATT